LRDLTRRLERLEASACPNEPNREALVAFLARCPKDVLRLLTKSLLNGSSGSHKHYFIGWDERRVWLKEPNTRRLLKEYRRTEAPNGEAPS